MFNSSRIKEDKARSLAIIAGLVPLVAIFSSNAAWPTSSDEGINVVGRPASWVFTTVWIIIVLALLFTSVVASLRMDTVYLIITSIVIILIGIVSTLWLFYNNNQRNEGMANQIMVSLIFLTLFLLVLCLRTQTDIEEENVRTTLSSLAIIPLGWSMTATLLGFIKANK